MSKKKLLDSIGNPAELFISTAAQREPMEQDSTPSRPIRPAQGYKANPEYIETRSQRVQLLMQPSLYRELKRAAKKQKRSANDLIHTILEDYIAKEHTNG